MATYTWNVYSNTPAWWNMASNTVVFSGSTTDLTVPITVDSTIYNTGTHLGSGDPGTDACGGSTHMPNVAWTATNSYSYNGGASTALSAMVQTHCTFQILFTDASSVATSDGYFYTYDSTTATTEATGIEAWAFEQGNGTQWTQINDDSGNIGGNNSGERLSLANQSAATSHTFYIAVSARPESVGAKGDFQFGITLTYS